MNLEHIMEEARSLLSPQPHNYYTTARSKSNCTHGKTPEPPVCRSGGTDAVDTPSLSQAAEESMVLSKAVTLPQLPTGTSGIPGTWRQPVSPQPACRTPGSNFLCAPLHPLLASLSLSTCSAQVHHRSLYICAKKLTKSA